MNKKFFQGLFVITFTMLSFTANAQWINHDIEDSTFLNLRVYSVKFANVNTGYAAGSAIFNQSGVFTGGVYKTTNAGVNWSVMNIPTFSFAYEIELIDANNIFITCDTSTIIRTTNGGNSWTRLTTPSVSSEMFSWNLSFINSSTGWISTPKSSASQKTFQTTNSGNTWTVANVLQGFSRIKFIDNQNGKAANNTGFFITTNGGINWTITIQDSLLSDFTFLNNNTGWLFSKKSVSNSAVKGRSWKTTNAGLNWLVLYSNDSSETGFYGSVFFNELTGYANCYNNQSGIMKTTTGGMNWFNPTDFRLTLSPVNAPIFFLNANTGWFAQESYHAYSTATGPGSTMNTYFSSYQKYQNSNNISNYISVYGELTSSHTDPYLAGMEYPKGSGNYCMYHSGLVMGAKINGQLCVSDSYSWKDFTPGKFDGAGNEIGHDKGEYGLYQIKAGDGPGTPDWDNWPASQGAPFAGGQPQLIGQQTTFVSFTDGVRGGFLGNTPPLKAEVKLTSYTFNDELRKDAIYYKLDITNKNSLNWDSAYISFFVDPDIGASEDDKMGCDTTLNLIYGYNGNGSDPSYGNTPPAVGYKLVSTSPGLKLSSCVPFYNTGGTADPCLTDAGSAQEVYFYQKGFNRCGAPYTYSGNNMKFVYTGNPETNSGWFSTVGGDVRLAMNFGPINLASGQSVSIVVAALVARGTNNKNSVTKLKQYAATLPLDVQQVSSVVPNQFRLNQNFPNPFNPVTKISYSVPKASFIELNVYDISGRLVKNLFSGKHTEGNYEVDFNGESLASGIYICRMNSENYTNSIKMILVK
jgi:photosystem II stability/assembly factor-like uncharacterized protein